MTIKDKKSNTISIEKQQKTALSSGKIDKYEYLTDEEILPTDQSRMIGNVTFS